jgi:enoyl-CoA hydratase
MGGVVMRNLTFEQRGAVGVLRVNRPDHYNSLNRSTLEEMRDFFDVASNLRALVLTGVGQAFIAGADIHEIQEMSPEAMFDFLRLGQEVANDIETAPFVTIAAVNGYALGGGLEMALACDFIYAAREAKLGLPEVSLGMIPGFGGTQRLARAIGARGAKELIFSGRSITAEEAFNINLVNRLCEPETLIEQCYATISTILRNSFTAAMHAKEAIGEGFGLDPHDALELEQNLALVCFSSLDRLEGMEAFLNKREPHFA